MILIIKLIEIVLVVCVWNSFVFASFFLRPYKKSFVYHLRPHPISRPHRYFFICLIPHENKVYGFVSVVVMNYKSKKTHDFPGFWE